MLEYVFLACFGFGALVIVASFVLGFAGHLPGHLAHGAGHAAQGNGHTGHLPHLEHFNPTSILAFLTWFGAAGYLLLHFVPWSIYLVLGGALLAGMVAALLLTRFLEFALAGSVELDPADFRLEGTLARVTVRIPAGGVGEVVFSKAGRRRSEAARAESGEAIARGTDVVIVSYERGVAHVRPYAEMLAAREGRAAGPAAASGK